MAAIEWIASNPHWREQFGPPNTDFASVIACADFTPQDLALAYRRTGASQPLDDAAPLRVFGTNARCKAIRRNRDPKSAR
jgi:hypothetical protein